MRNVLLAAILAAAPSLALSGAEAAPGDLLPHRAVYDLTLKEATDRSGISSVVGRMVYEFNGSACDGYTTNFRFVTRVGAGDQERLTDQQTTTFEAGDGASFSFATKSFVDQKPDKEVRGTATKTGSRVSVDLSKPETAELSLDTAFFPTAHMIDLIGKAKAGETLYEAPIFDGSEDADRTMTTTVIIGKPNTQSDGDAAASGDLAGKSWWPVSISYFDETKKDGDGLPEYRIGFKLYETGVTRDLEMDYGDFVMAGQLKGLEVLDAPACD